MSRPRIIYLDDSHPSLRYVGQWDEVGGTFEEDVHSVFGGRQRIIRGSGSVSFDFTGTELRMLGRFAPVRSGSGVRPTFRCYLNGVEFQGDSPPSRPSNAFTFCYRGGSNLPAGATHSFRLEVEADASAPLWVDSVYIRPNVDSSYSNFWTRLTPRDPSVRLGPSWEVIDNGDVRYTSQAGSFAEVDFIGSRAIWQGSALVNQPTGQSRATYSIDGGPAIPFSFTGRIQSFDPGHKVYFTTDQLPHGRHNLRVTYEGFEAPLLFNHVFIQDGNMLEDNPRTLPGPAPSPGPTARPAPTGGSSPTEDPPSSPEPSNRDSDPPSNNTPTESDTRGLGESSPTSRPSSESEGGRPTGTSGDNTSQANNSLNPSVIVLPGNSEGSSSTGQVGGSKSMPTGAIIGGVLGGVAVLLAMILFVLFVVKRRRRNGLLGRPGSIFLGSPTHAYGAAGFGNNMASRSSEPLVAAHGMNSKNADSQQRGSGADIAQGPIPSPSSSGSQQQPRYHQDSGIRLNAPPGVDIPPSYTPA
ncbi:hypothetical protein FA15DRAFT_372679 [Coprinopsis marcescibilis]|uniref:Uncharacterized protein n=1 Tax=Coprinopsis marcescibilis TaxID=230819 RepID=A0A5C3KY68_COPMA|nr:hypothetical protein FA15DRAFT_372679 [Coprinopsis marcescibilis]